MATASVTVSEAFLEELRVQRAEAMHEMARARAALDEPAYLVAVGRIVDLDELARRNGVPSRARG